jgi:TonB family protein
VPVAQAGTGGSTSPDASADNSIGSSFGSNDGSGLGSLGMGRGKGDGFGDIDWGGGGNRTVENKVIPNFPPGHLNTKITLLFRVAPDGTVVYAEVKTKSGNKAVEQAAIAALRRWRFNKLATSTVMEGVITFRVTYQ